MSEVVRLPRAGLLRALATALAAAVLLAASLAAAQVPVGPDYRLGPGDQVQLSVLQQPDLDRPLTVRADGVVVVPLVGEIAVAGLTVREAGDLIRQRLRLFNRDITDVALAVTQPNALRVAVLGAVTRPGEYTFPDTPSVWDALLAAGGPSAVANMAAVRVVRQEGDDTRTEFHDLSGILNGQDIVPPVPLRGGDAVVVPSREEGLASPAANTVQVIGGVARQGSFPLTTPARLVSVLVMAGGALETGNLGEVWWVHEEGGGRYRSTKVDVDDFMKKGSLAGNPVIYPGDTVRVPFRGQGFFRGVWPVLLSTVTAATAILIAANR